MITIRKAMIPILLFFLFSIFTYAGQDYTRVGQDLFVSGFGYFNDALDTEVALSVGITGYQAPLIADLDNDNRNEIVFQNANSIGVANKTGNSLNVEAIYPLTTSSISNMVLFDIDSNSLVDIIFFDNDNARIFFLEYDGTSFSPTNFSIGGAVDRSQVGCDSTNDRCIVDREDSGVRRLRAFTKTANGSADTTISQGGFSLCQPFIPYIPSLDHNLDGEVAFALSYYSLNGVSGADRLRLYYFETNSSLDLITDGTTVNYQLPTSWHGNGFNCNTAADNSIHLITAPSVADYTQADFGLETVVGAVIDARDSVQEFKIYRFSYDSSSPEQTVPFLTDGEGFMVSNIVQTDAFDDTETDENFCVMGYDHEESKIEFLCGSSERCTGCLNNIEFEYTISENVTEDIDHYAPVVHAVDMLRATYGGQDFNEILTPYGVFELIHTLHPDASAGCQSEITKNCQMELIWDSPVSESALIPIDYEKTGSHDIIGVSATNLWYIDDNINNISCSDQNCIQEITTNPCLLDAVATKINTTLQIFVTVEDFDSNPVNARAILYNGAENEQDSGWTINYTSGTSIPFTNLLLNKTGTGTLRIMARESTDPGDTETLDYVFTVATEGVEFGDCTSSFEAPTGEALNVSAVPVTNVNDNSITDTLDTFFGLTGLSRGIIWLIIMVFLGVVILGGFTLYGGTGVKEFWATIGLVLLIEFIMLILGVQLGYISLGIVIAIVVFALAIVGVFVGRTIAGDR